MLTPEVFFMTAFCGNNCVSVMYNFLSMYSRVFAALLELTLFVQLFANYEADVGANLHFVLLDMGFARSLLNGIVI